MLQTIWHHISVHFSLLFRWCQIVCSILFDLYYCMTSSEQSTLLRWQQTPNEIDVYVCVLKSYPKVRRTVSKSLEQNEIMTTNTRTPYSKTCSAHNGCTLLVPKRSQNMRAYLINRVQVHLPWTFCLKITKFSKILYTTWVI